jgi:hypothetical protein
MYIDLGLEVKVFKRNFDMFWVFVFILSYQTFFSILDKYLKKNTILGQINTFWNIHSLAKSFQFRATELATQ